MEKDAEETDKFDRLLRYVFLPPPDGRLLNEEMLGAGMARVYTRFPFSRKDAFLAAEGRARREGKGLWKDGGMAEARWLAAGNAAPVEVYPSGGRTFVVAYKGLAKAGVERGDLPKEIEGILRLRGELSDAEFASKARDRGFRPIGPSIAGPAGPGPPGRRALPPAPAIGGTVIPWEEAHRHQGEEIVVEGTIVRTHRAEKVMYLNFHANWKRYLTLVIHVKDLPRFPVDPDKAYRGRKVRARGEVKLYKDRLEMVVRSPGDITVVRSERPDPWNGPAESHFAGGLPDIIPQTAGGPRSRAPGVTRDDPDAALRFVGLDPHPVERPVDEERGDRGRRPPQGCGSRPDRA